MAICAAGRGGMEIKMRMIKHLIFVLFIFPVIGIACLLKGPKKFKGELKEKRKWYRIELPHCHTADGNKFFFFVKKGESNNLLVNFSGGGVAWNEETASKPGTIATVLLGQVAYYFARSSSLFLIMAKGVLSLNDSNNPFDNWNVVHIPYTTGDFHTGNGKLVYKNKRGQQKTCHFTGEKNINGVLDKVKELFPQVNQLAVSGESAGGFGCVAQGDNVANRYPEARQVTIISDCAQLTFPEWKSTVKEVWKAPPRFHETLGEEGDLIGDWFVRLDRKIDAVFLHINSPQDEALIRYQSKMMGKTFEVTPEAKTAFFTSLNKTVRRLVHEIPEYRCFIDDFEKDEKQGTTAHTTLGENKRLHHLTPEGISLAGWIRKAINREEVPNVGLSLLDEYDPYNT